MKRTTSLLSALVVASVMLSGCGKQTSTDVAEQAPEVQSENIEAHIAFLADDTLRGRDTGSNGYQVAANYVSSYFKQYGLTPMGDFGSYEQQVNFRKSFLEQAKFTITNEAGEHTVEYPQQFITSGSSLYVDETVSAETVFVGYGVVDKAFELNDYEGLDVKGKVVVMLMGRPDHLPSEEGAHIGSTHQKLKHAAENGAVGVITIHTPKREKVRSFSVSAKYANAPRYSWLDNNDQPFGHYAELKGGAYVDYQFAAPLFAGAEKTLEDVLTLDNENQTIKGFALKSTVELENKSSHRQVSSPNVVAAIEGSDPELKNEYVVFSAHLDHIGVSAHGDHEDKINNGALDNASGVSILLETARMMSELAVKPKRSVLFVVVAGEERGLLGSSYFANNPTVPATQMVANVNLDMPLVLYPFADVIAFGSTHSTLGTIVDAAAKKVGLSLSEDPMPEQALFTRSDHYSFVKVGVPSVFLMTGFQSKDPNIDGGKVFKEFLSTHYHNHSDEISLPINYQAAATFAEVNLMIGLEIANQQQKPQWLEGDFFGNTFAQ